MDRFKSVDEILDFAIDGEVTSVQFYMGLAKRVETQEMKKVFEDFAKEELGHKAKLQEMKANKWAITADEDVPNLNIADYLVDVELGADMSYKDALVVAMKREKAAYRLYLDLAAVAEAEELTETFLWLAQEEAKHKLRFEIEYDDEVLKDN
ncbi:MAG: ferritin family protein [Planctomycetota bacterium]|nr:MAG: ferritin family protein [Planctomycetota bacterium]